MSIRFPKKNIAQHQRDRQNKKLVPKTTEIVLVKSEYDDIPALPGPCANSLYPIRLQRLHEDLAQLGHMGSLPPKERQELQKRLPGSLVQAEAKADKILEGFVRRVVKQQGQEVYGRRLKEAMTSQARLMLAIRCWIAAKTTDAPKNVIKIYRNKVMEAWEFFPESSRQSVTDPNTGESSIHITYDTDTKAPYKRQEEVQSDKHYEVMKITEPGPKKIDKMPKRWGDLMTEVLEDAGHEVTSINQAWKLLDRVSQNSTIEEKILSKIAYLITHAAVYHKNKLLPG